jgi:glycosyltransferase involved in cell wall biosynthesis
MKKIAISTITPVYSGKDYLEELVNSIKKMKDKWENENAPLDLIEAIFVNDDAKDRSFQILNDLRKKYQWVKVFSLSKNFGQHQATIAGILNSSGQWIVTMDEDMQHDPKFIPYLLEKAVENNNDIIYVKPEEDVHQSFLRDLGSRGYKGIVEKLTRNPHVKKFNSYRLVRGSIARAAASVCTYQTYFDISLCWYTNRIQSVSLKLKDRRFIETGNSGYDLRKLFSHGKGLIISNEAKILRVGAIIGALALMLSFFISLYLIIKKIYFPNSIPIQGWTSIFVTLLFFGGLLSFLIGVVIEYITMILLHIQGKPTFFSIDRSSDDILITYFKKNENY